MVRVPDYFSYLESKKIRPYNNRRPNISIIQIKQNFLLLIIRQRTASNPSIHYNSRASGANNIYKNYSFWLWRFNWFNKLPYLLRQVKTRILTKPEGKEKKWQTLFSPSSTKVGCISALLTEATTDVNLLGRKFLLMGRMF